MTTLKEIVELWDKENPKMQTETINKKNAEHPKIRFGKMHKSSGEQAVIKLADNFPFEPWGNRTCYVFGTKNDSINPEKNSFLDIGFERRIKEDPNTRKFYNFLNEKFKNETINEKKFIFSQGKINHNHLTLKIKFEPDTSAQEICYCMKKFIELTQKPIYEFLKPKKSENNLSIDPIKNEQKNVFDKILNKHNIKKEDKLYNICEKIYFSTCDILKKLVVVFSSKDFKELEVSHYTKKIIASKLLISSKEENKYDEFRLNYISGMNDPTEGKTLLHFIGIENEELKLPKNLPFIACFSFNVNSLNQFRLYGKEDGKEATGVSILFKPAFFNEDKYLLYRCIYMDPDNGRVKAISFNETEKEEEKQEMIYDKELETDAESETIEDLQEEMEKKLKELKHMCENLKKEEVAINVNKTELLTDLLINIRYLIKDYAFIEEQECRIINIKDKTDKAIKFCEDRLYITAGEIKDYVNKIYFGPCAEGSEVFEVKTNIGCIRSRHPYRGN